MLLATAYAENRYLLDPEATTTAHDDEGWYRTGDIARQDAGGFWFIVGRASVDIIKSGGYKISALDIEREVLKLPYVAEAMIVGVDDEEFGQRVGAVLAVNTTTNNGSGENFTLAQLRNDLRGRLAGYQLPTILRVVQGELPKGATGKVQKKILGPELIPSPGYENVPEVQVWKGQGGPRSGSGTGAGAGSGQQAKL